MNTAHRLIDHCDAGWLGCFEEDLGLKWMDGLLSNPKCQAGYSHIGPFMDSYHYFYLKQERAFNLLPEVMGSDQCPVGAVLNVSCMPARVPLSVHPFPP